MGILIENFMLQNKLIATKQKIRSHTQTNFAEEEEVVGPNYFIVYSGCRELEVDDFMYSLEDSTETGFID